MIKQCIFTRGFCLILFSLFILMCVSTQKVHAIENLDPLLRVLIKKGILTEQEAIEIQKEAKQLKKQEEERRLAKIDSGSKVPKGLKGIKVGMLTYLDYSIGKEPLASSESGFYSRFRITRGYFTVKKTLTPDLKVRITTDVHQDSIGDWKLRLKYLYAELHPKDLGLLTDIKAEIGMGHIPWLDFEEHVNPYRCQGTMAIERAGVFNSADLGISLRGYLGGRLEDPVSKTGSSHYAGRYGSWHIGLYNGSGYHASENNSNKVVEGRLTIRPLPDRVPGLQFSYMGIAGEGNREYSGDYPNYFVNLGMVSYEHPRLILTAQRFWTTGNAKGNWVVLDPVTGGLRSELNTSGYSFFGNLRLPALKDRLSVFARYDHFDPDTRAEISNSAAYDMLFAGLAFETGRGDTILATFETTSYEKDSGGKTAVPSLDLDLGDDYRFQLVYQLKY